MNRFDRALAILLLLRSGKTFSAPDLAQRLEVSVRTIYRDIETLNEVGVPVYAETGRTGGFHLIEGYFLPPIAFTLGEATSLITGLALLDRLRSRPFAAELDTAAHKLLAVVPEAQRDVLSRLQRVIGFEAIPEDIFHPEPAVNSDYDDQIAGRTNTVFLRCLFDQQVVSLVYRSPYISDSDNTGSGDTQTVIPYGILWDRDHWYLVGRKLSSSDERPRLWRADRVLTIAPHPQSIRSPDVFCADDLLGRQWLAEAMAKWAGMSPVVIRMTDAQAERLQHDWYYAHARFETSPGYPGQVLMTFGESDRKLVFEMLRWLGAGAELIEPQAWRDTFVAELQTMLMTYNS
ncbi:MAG TPA: WYL domain-containing protein [Phototrophicaceae bacterium]|nr:WYL domain-containing protein [Phototrophicaceae bacterium]